MVVAGAQPTGGEAESSIYAQTIEEPELGKVQSGLLLIDLPNAHQMIKNLRHADRCQAGITASKQLRDFSRCGLVR